MTTLADGARAPQGRPLLTNEVPTKIEGLTNVAVVAAGFFETCAITTAGGAKCWGKSDSGELGSGTLDPSVSSIATPADVAGLTGVTSLSVGQAYACAIAGGAAKCWGDNYDGCIGNGKDAGFQTAAPVDVTGLGTGMVAISAKAQHACALSRRGRGVLLGREPERSARQQHHRPRSRLADPGARAQLPVASSLGAASPASVVAYHPGDALL